MRRLLKDNGTYDRAAIVARSNAQLADARRLGLDWDRAHCLEYVWRQARAQRAAFLGVPLAAPAVRKTLKLRAPGLHKNGGRPARGVST